MSVDKCYVVYASVTMRFYTQATSLGSATERLQGKVTPEFWQALTHLVAFVLAQDLTIPSSAVSQALTPHCVCAITA